MNTVFISYSRRDLNFVRQLLQGLKQQKIDPWLDLEDLPPAIPWKEEILQAVQCCNDFLFVISPESAVSEYCNLELNCALRHNKRLIPILCRHTDLKLIHPAIAELNWIFFNNFEFGLSQVIEVIEAPQGDLKSVGGRGSAFIEVFDDRGFRRFPLNRNNYLIGRFPGENREAGSLIVFDSSRFTSKIHLEIKYADGSWQINNKGRNGFVAFPPLSDRKLSNDTKLFLGQKCYLVFKEEKLLSEEKDDGDTVF